MQTFQRAIARLKVFQVLSFVRQDRNVYMNKIIYILAFCINCFGPLIQEDGKIDELIKKFQEDKMDDQFFANMPDDFMADLDPIEDDVEDKDKDEDEDGNIPPPPSEG